MQPIKPGRGTTREDRQGGFVVGILHLGLALTANDSGIGAIGRVDRARVRPGHVIKMHPHRDGEILTCIRTGKTLHRDTVGDEEEITKALLMLVNAGHIFQHNEKMLGPEPVEALQLGPSSN